MVSGWGMRGCVGVWKIIYCINNFEWDVKTKFNDGDVVSFSCSFFFRLLIFFLLKTN